MLRLYYYPPLHGSSYGNPYSDNYRAELSKYFRIVNRPSRWYAGMSGSLFLSMFRADVYVLNWVENIRFFAYGLWQYRLLRLVLWVLRLRGARIVWMFHNMEPHGGHNKESHALHEYLFQHSALIISHSRAATEYAKARAACPVHYVCHPVKPLALGTFEGEIAPCDVFIWGTIVGYKGIAEFVEEHAQRASTLGVHILGKCKDEALAARIAGRCNERVTFENRRASFEEIAAYCQHSRWVLFPYVGQCVSSSGAIIDTIVMGGTPIGPHVGAFADLAEEHVCITYHGYDALFQLLSTTATITPAQRQAFIERNSWEGIGKLAYREIMSN